MSRNGPKMAATTPLSLRDRLFVDDLKELSMIGNDSDFVRFAFRKVAEWYKHDVPPGVLELRHHAKNGRGRKSA